jgi:hypothetical protein
MPLSRLRLAKQPGVEEMLARGASVATIALRHPSNCLVCRAAQHLTALKA